MYITFFVFRVFGECIVAILVCHDDEIIFSSPVVAELGRCVEGKSHTVGACVGARGTARVYVCSYYLACCTRCQVIGRLVQADTVLRIQT